MGHCCSFILTKAADPEDDPPLILVLLWGLTTGPVAAVKLPPLQHKFSTQLFPTMCPPASNIRVTTVASTSGTNPSRMREPFIMGTPATHVLSLTATVLPWSLPLDAPLMSHRQYLKWNVIYFHLRSFSVLGYEATCWEQGIASAVWYLSDPNIILSFPTSSFAVKLVWRSKGLSNA